MDANGKVAVITGASDGLGAVLAQQLAAAGYHVWVLARNEAKLQAVVGAIRSGGGQADYAVCDVTSPESVAQSFAHIGAQAGQVDLLISNAGVWLQGATADATTDDIVRTINTNLLGIILVTIILVIINEYTALTWISDYALILIIAGMFLGVWLVKRWLSSKDE